MASLNSFYLSFLDYFIKRQHLLNQAYSKLKIYFGSAVFIGHIRPCCAGDGEKSNSFNSKASVNLGVSHSASFLSHIYGLFVGCD